MGRGKSLKNLALIDAAIEILAVIQPATIRAVCYQLFIRKLLASMSKNSTNRVSVQLRDARERGVLPWTWIVDETRDVECVNAWEDPAAYVETVKRCYRRDRWANQPCRIEVWSEKGTVRGTLAPVLHEYGVPFRVMHGYGSATTVHDVAVDSAERDKPTVALYAGDWDCSGLHMSDADLPSRIARYGGQIEIVRVALTWEHVTLGDLPHFSVEDKRTDARYDWFVTYHGRTCWELDALRPDVLRRAVEAAIISRLDLPSWDQAGQAEEAERESLVTILNAWPGISRQARE